MLAIASTIAISMFAVAMILLKLERHRAPVNPSRKPTDAMDTIEAWPPQTVRVLTLEERQAYDIVRRAMPRHLVLGQVPLSRFISVPTKNAYADWLQRVGRQSVDLLITDASSRPIAAIEVRGTAESQRSLKRHETLTRVLQAAGIPVHVWREGALPSAEQAYRQLRGHPASLDGMPEDDTDQAHQPIPVADVHEILAEGDDRHYGHDPVASSFFDDIDVLATAGKA